MKKGSYGKPMPSKPGKPSWRQEKVIRLTWGADNGTGRHLLTPRYCFLAQNAFYGLALDVIKRVR